MDRFSALADPTRRSILELVATHGGMSTTDISSNFSMSQPAISQHLKVLRTADLLVMEKRAQQHLYTVNKDTLLEIEDWVRRMGRVWNARLDRLEEVLRKEKRTYIPKKKGRKI